MNEDNTTPQLLKSITKGIDYSRCIEDQTIPENVVLIEDDTAVVITFTPGTDFILSPSTIFFQKEQLCHSQIIKS
jgi:hypothetical protein